MTEREAALAEAMRAGRRGDSAAYSRALAEVARLVRPKVARTLGSGAGETEDVVQNVLLAVHLKNASWDDRLPILPWVYAIAEHKALDALRSRRRSARYVSQDLSAEDVAEVIAAPEPERDSLGLDLERLLAALSGRERQVVRALALEGGTIAGAASAFGMKEGAVRVAFHRGLKRLARAADRDYGPNGSRPREAM